MKEITKLKPCPFCGHDVIESKNNPKCYMPVTIFCNLCGAALSAFSMEDAIEQWNTRYPDEDGVLKAISVAERIRRAIDQDFCDRGASRELRIFISKDLLAALRRECVIAKSPEGVATTAFFGQEVEIVDGVNRLYLARRI